MAFGRQYNRNYAKLNGQIKDSALVVYNHNKYTMHNKSKDGGHSN